MWSRSISLSQVYIAPYHPYVWTSRNTFGKYYALLSMTPFDTTAQESLSVISFHHLSTRLSGCRATQYQNVPCHVGPRRVVKDLASSSGEFCTVWEVEDIREGEFLDVSRYYVMKESNERLLTSPAIYFCFDRMTSYTFSFLPSSLMRLSNTAMSVVNPLALKSFRVNQGCRG